MWTLLYSQDIINNFYFSLFTDYSFHLYFSFSFFFQLFKLSCSFLSLNNHLRNSKYISSLVFFRFFFLSCFYNILFLIIYNWTTINLLAFGNFFFHPSNLLYHWFLRVVVCFVLLFFSLFSPCTWYSSSLVSSNDSNYLTYLDILTHGNFYYFPFGAASIFCYYSYVPN